MRGLPVGSLQAHADLAPFDSVRKIYSHSVCLLLVRQSESRTCPILEPVIRAQEHFNLRLTQFDQDLFHTILSTIRIEMLHHGFSSYLQLSSVALVHVKQDKRMHIRKDVRFI